jgi:hypothetical protein
MLVRSDRRCCEQSFHPRSVLKTMGEQVVTHPINFGPVFIGFADEIGELGRTLRTRVIQDSARILVAPPHGWTNHE